MKSFTSNSSSFVNSGHRIALLPLLTAAALTTVSAQTVYEAEASSNVVSGSANIAICTVCSGGKNAQNIGGPGKGTLQFNSIQIPTAGTYPVAVTYDNGASVALSAALTVNGKPTLTASFPSTGSWTRLATLSLNIPFQAGSNSLLIAGLNSGYVVEIDKIALQTQSTNPAPPPPPPPPPVNTVLLTSFGQVGSGGNDTSIFQNAINSAAQNGKVLQVPAGVYNVGPLTFPNNAKLLLDAQATVQATTGFSSGQRLLNVVNVSNVSITGTPGKNIFKMQKSEYTSGEYRHCLDIEGATNVTITGISCNDSGGDGLYIGGGSRGYSDTVNVSQSSFNNNRRQGFSLISGKNITITNCSFTNTNGTAPESGIDIEPNTTSDVLQNIVITNSSASGNHGEGLMVSIGNLNYSSPAISISVSQFSSSNNGRSGYFATNEHDDNVPGVVGTVTIQNSTSTNDAAYGAVASFYDANSAALLFQNMSIVNPNSSRSTYDGAAIGVKRGGGDRSLMGGVTFAGTTISGNNGNLQHYLTVEDYSGSGLHNISIANWGALSGIPAGNSYGIVNGQSVNSVNIQ